MLYHHILQSSDYYNHLATRHLEEIVQDDIASLIQSLLGNPIVLCLFTMRQLDTSYFKI